jgi:hypothetical protein
LQIRDDMTPLTTSMPAPESMAPIEVVSAENSPSSLPAVPVSEGDVTDTEVPLSLDQKGEDSIAEDITTSSPLPLAEEYQSSSIGVSGGTRSKSPLLAPMVCAAEAPAQKTKSLQY